MTDGARLSSADLYARIGDALLIDPTLEEALLNDFEGTLAERFQAVLKVPGKLVRTDEGYRLSVNGYDFDIGKPSPNGELSDAELELVSAGALFTDDPRICGGGPVEGKPLDHTVYKYDHSNQRVS